MLKGSEIWLGTSSDNPVCFLPKMANRHGLVAGATGTGKTVTLQVMAEGFSSLGVPVFMPDIKGDLAGISRPGAMNDRIAARLAACGADALAFDAFPTVFWDVYGQQGHPVRTTASEMGPLLMARMLDLNETQAGVLHLCFRIADDEGLLLIDLKDLRAMLAYVGENAEKYTLRYGNIAGASVGAIQRAIAVLEDQGGTLFFGEPRLELADWLARDSAGRGVVNILAADQLFLHPSMYSAFLLWMLGELYELLPEQGDKSLPRMVFFFDEAHLLFEDCPKALMDKIELIVRLVRSKGVGVFFVTQNPMDVPTGVLSQLSGRVQHALRAFTPAELRVVKSVAQTFRTNPKFDTEQALTQLATGEALVSFLLEDGTPSVTQKTLILPPQGSIGAIPKELRGAAVSASVYAGKYEKALDRESAYEILSARITGQSLASAAPLHVQTTSSPVVFKVYDPATGGYMERQLLPTVPQPAPMPVLVYNTSSGQYEPSAATPAPAKEQPAKARGRQEKSLGEKMVESLARSAATGAGSALGRNVTRNILGMLGIK
jgi:uncharacterized protein